MDSFVTFVCALAFFNSRAIAMNKAADDGLGMGLVNNKSYVADLFGLSNKANGLSWVKYNNLLSILPTNCSQIYKNFRFSYHLRETVPNRNLMFLSVILMLSGDICMNPGPGTQAQYNVGEAEESSFPCLLCRENVDWSVDALQCDGCDNWLNRECIRMSSDEYERLAGLTATWLSCHCGLMNISTDLFNKSTIELHDEFSELRDSGGEFPSLDAATWTPMHSSSPKSEPKQKRTRNVQRKDQLSS